jgi:hypothetical protein
MFLWQRYGAAGGTGISDLIEFRVVIVIAAAILIASLIVTSFAGSFRVLLPSSPTLAPTSCATITARALTM